MGVEEKDGTTGFITEPVSSSGGDGGSRGGSAPVIKGEGAAETDKRGSGGGSGGRCTVESGCVGNKAEE